MSVIAERPPGIVSGGPFALHRSSSIYDVCRQVSDRPTNFQRLTGKILRSEHPPATSWQAQGRMGEQHVADALRDVRTLYVDKLDLSPVPDPYLDTGFEFRRSSDGNVTVFDEQSGNAVFEVDGVFDINGTKVVYDVKTALLKDHAAAALTGRRIDRIVGPMQRMFRRSPIAYVLFTPVDTIELSVSSPTLTELDEFAMLGGIVASIPQLAGFREAAQSAFTKLNEAA